MLSIFAQADPSNEALASWVKIFLYLGGGVAGLAVAWSQLFGKASKMKISPQPLIVAEQVTHATREEIRQVHGRIERERKEINVAMIELREADQRLRERLDSEIKDMRQAMDDIPERTINLLKATKDLI